MNTDYSALLKEYPAIISMDQLYKICHVSKRKAKWLLEHGVIPCEDNGNQTRRFSIKLTDVIAFLKNLEQGYEAHHSVPKDICKVKVSGHNDLTYFPLCIT